MRIHPPLTGTLVTVLLVGVVSSCGPAPTQQAAPAAQTSRGFAAPLLGTAALPASQTPTPVSFEFDFTPVPSETPLPTLEIPTMLPNPPALQIWDGLPTYPADSRPGFMFRVRFDPDLWGLTTDNYGFPALAHRSIPSCVIAPASGHGLPPSLVVEHDQKKLGSISYEVNTAYLNGAPQFVTYQGGDGDIFTGFEVRFESQSSACIQQAETVLSSLASVPAAQATPNP